MSHEASVTLVPFRGDEITCVETPDGVFVPIKPICERFGLDWKSQHRKLSANEMRWGMVMMTIPSVGGEQETCCIPVTKVFGWLATISPSKVKPEVRDSLLAYQTEADEVLDRHFRQREERLEAEHARTLRQLHAAQDQLMIASPKLHAVAVLACRGTPVETIANRVRWPKVRVEDELAILADCGIGLSKFGQPVLRDLYCSDRERHAASAQLDLAFGETADVR